MKNKTILSKITPIATLFTLLYIGAESFIFNVSLDWVLYRVNSYQNHQKWFPNTAALSFVVFKIIPITLIMLSILLNLLLIVQSKLNLLKIYKYVWIKNKFGLLTVLILIVVLVSPQILENNKNYAVLLLSSCSILFVFFMARVNFSKKWQIIFLVVLAFILRWFYYQFSGAIDFKEDSMARVSQVYSWLHYGGLPGGLNWPFMHHISMYYTAKLFNVSIEEGGRIFTLICSVVLIPFAYKLFALLFNKTTAFFSIFIYAINPFLIQFSTIQMTEIPFLFFISFGIYYAYKFFKKNRISFFFLSAISLNIASLIRFEAWIIVPLFFVVFTLRYSQFNKALKWFFVSMLGAFFFSFYSYLVSGNPISGVTASDVEVIATLQDSSWYISLKRIVFESWWPLSFIFLLGVGFLYNIIKGKNKYLSTALFVLISYYFYKMMSLTLMPFWRYLIFVMFFITPMAFYYISKKMSSFGVFLLVCVFVLPFSLKNMEVVYQSYMPPKVGFVESAEYVRQKFRNPTNRFILSISPWGEDDLWLVKSGLFDDCKTFKRLHPGSGNNDYNEKFTSGNVAKNIISRGYNVILVESGYEIDSVFNSNEVISFLSDKEIDTTKWEEYTLYQIN